MSSIDKTEEAYKTIGEVTKELGLVDKKTGRLQTHTIRYWETQFRQIKPNIKAGGRRYYSAKIFKIIKYIKFLLKDRGLTINGAKKILNTATTHSIDDIMNIGINRPELKTTIAIKRKIKNISKIIQELKKFK
jgi:DNA-binding transcriptional MerR regulator